MKSGEVYSPSGISQEFERILSEEQIKQGASSPELILANQTPLKVGRLIEHFSKNFPGGMEILQRGGVHPFRPGDLKDPQTGEPCHEEFGHIGEHCIATAYAASKICSVLETLGKLKPLESKRIIERALIHDASKAFEILTHRAIQNLKRAQEPDLFLSSSALNENLRKFEKSLNYCGKECGHQHISQFLVVGYQGLRGLQKGMLAQKIVRLVDDLTATTLPTQTRPAESYFLSVADRIVVARFHERYPKLFKSGLGVRRGLSGYQIVELRNITQVPGNVQVLGSHVHLQIRVALQIAQELQNLIDPTSTDDAMSFILSLIKES